MRLNYTEREVGGGEWEVVNMWRAGLRGRESDCRLDRRKSSLVYEFRPGWRGSPGGRSTVAAVLFVDELTFKGGHPGRLDRRQFCSFLRGDVPGLCKALLARELKPRHRLHVITLRTISGVEQ